MKKKEKKQFDITVHYSIENRKKFKGKMWLRFVLLIVILVGCAVMVMFGGWSWNPDEGFKPAANPKQAYQYALIVLGAVIALLAIVGYTLWNLKTFKGFYDSQQEYFKTKDFKEKKEKVLKQDPTKLKKSTIKWYKKLGYLTGSQKNDWLAKLNDSKRTKKK